jgi:uncharacterized membrane protein
MESKRYAELDILRGIAVLCMVLYHLLFDLSFFYGWDIEVMRGFWKMFAYATASLFLILIGVCSVISWDRSSHNIRWKKTLRRSFIIFIGGMCISFITWIVAPQEFVKFGILHLIGISALLQPFFFRLNKWNIGIGIILFIFGIYLSDLSMRLSFLFPLGIKYPGFTSLDYYPLLPWFGMILMGMGLGYRLYVPIDPSRRRQKSCHTEEIRSGSSRSIYTFWFLLRMTLEQIGQNALLLYFVHQPILFAMLFLLLGFPS